MEKKGLVILMYKQWGLHKKQASLITELTPSGLSIAKKLWIQTPDPFKKISLKVKEYIFPLNPEIIRKQVHREYPEYKKTYVDLDRD